MNRADFNTDNLDRELAGIRALAIIGSGSEDDTEHLNHLFCAVLELTERAQACLRDLEPRPAPSMKKGKVRR